MASSTDMERIVLRMNPPSLKISAPRPHDLSRGVRNATAGSALHATILLPHSTWEVATGLIAFALYSLSDARYRRI